MTESEAGQLRQGAARLGVAIDASAVTRLGRFLDLLDIWNRRLRLTGDRDRRVLLGKHVVDSLAVVPELPEAGMVVDVGSGAGFPGIVLACVRPELSFALIEPRRRPTSFLSEVIRTVPLPSVLALEMRAEEAAQAAAVAGRARLVVSRALRVDRLLELAPGFLAADGLLVAMQTPSLSEDQAGRRAQARGLVLVRSRDYHLPGGESRRLFVFGRS